MLSGHTDVVPVEGQDWTSDPFHLRARGQPPLRARRLRHEGVRRDLPRHAAGLPEGRAEATRAPPPQLRRGDRLPRLGRRDRALRQSTCPARRSPSSASRRKWASSTRTRASRPSRRSCTGVEAHSAKPDLGASALEAACDLVSELYRLADAAARKATPPAASTRPIRRSTSARSRAGRRATSWRGAAPSTGSSAACPARSATAR